MRKAGPVRWDVELQYQAYGYSTREAVQSIVENNLYGLDIDDRAAQLAYFAVMMKARQYDRRFFSRGIQPHVMAIQESNALEAFERLQGQLSMDTLCLETVDQLIRTFRDAKEYGSILNVDIPGLEHFGRVMEQLRAVQGDFELMAWVERAEALLPVLARQAVIMQQKYDVVVTNPPYMGSSGMNANLSNFVKTNYADYKSDFFSVFFVKCIQMAKSNGKLGFFSPYVWMFIQSYEKWRKLLIEQKTIETLIQFEYSAFEEATVPVCTFAFSNYHVDQKAPYLRLTEFRGGMEVQRKKALEAINNHDCGYYYEAMTSNFAKISGNTIAYWLNTQWFSVFSANREMRSLSIMKKGMSTGDNRRFMRCWYEVSIKTACFNAKDSQDAYSSHKKWFPITAGGEGRKWYGNRIHVVNWENNGKEMKDNATFLNHGGHWSRYIVSPDLFFLPHIAWSAISSSRITVRYMGKGFAFNSASMVVFDENILYYMALINSAVGSDILSALAPTLNYGVEQIGHIPVLLHNVDNVNTIVNDSIFLSRIDWDSYETSWDFQRHPLLQYFFSIHPAVSTGTERPLYEIRKDIGPDHHIEISQGYPTHAKIRVSYEAWRDACEQRFQQLKTNEEELNRIFIDIYGLQDELTPEVADKDVTVHRVFDTKEDVPESMQGSAYVRTKRDEVVSLISYAVGCMLGRYSLSKPGLAFAGGAWDAADYTSEFQPDQDGILPICDDDYFTDDIVGRFVRFIEVVYGKDTLEENLKFIADALGGPSRAGGKGTPRQVIRSYFLSDFYADHCKTYQKRPIYWLFDSGKKNGFKCLIYMHRYAPDTIARIRTDYVHEQQSRYRTAIAGLENRMASASTAERVKLQKQLAKLRDQAEETRVYEEKIHHYADQMIAIDLDDGVKVNYAKFQDVLGKIK